jgi:cbb3-type cytochrome oxidase maturation protein
MWVFYSLIVGSIVLLGGSALAVLYWAAKGGQFENFDAGSRSIFDSEEPEGQMTDAFPAIKAKGEWAREKIYDERK